MITDHKIALDFAKITNSGYWSVDDQYLFFNKAECLRFASLNDNSEVRYHFFDDFYNSLSWHEPIQGLEELYKKRALQLREKYDYLVIAFSGGADSSNIIDVFLDNRIHLDEIITSYPTQVIEKLKSTFDKNDRRACNLIFEYSEAAIPKLDEVKIKSPSTKITVLDHSNASIDLIMSNSLHKLPVGGLGASPSLAGHHMIAKRMRELCEKHNAVLITGVDKPRIGYNPKSKKFGVWFDDVSGVWGNHTLDSFQGFIPQTEHFYYSIDCPELWMKQIFILRRILHGIENNDVEKPATRLHYITKRGNHVYYMHSNFFKKILYKNWDTKIFQAGKPTGYFFQEHSDWFFKTNLTDQRTKDYHYGQVIEMIHGISNKYIKRDSTGKPLKFHEMMTRIITL
jgi:hypothetical protein